MNILIITVGSNPLPCYIVCNYLLNKDENIKKTISCVPIPDKLFFVYSSDTEQFYLNIKEVLKKNKIYDDRVVECNIADKERDFKFIKDRVEEKLNKIYDNESIDTIHLNFTGGTKTMSVHTYNAVKNYSKVEDDKKYYSDLDPYKHYLTLQTPNSDKINSIPTYIENSNNLQNYIKIGLEDLLQLHGMEWKNKNESIENKYERFQINSIRSFTKNVINTIYAKSKDEPSRNEFENTAKSFFQGKKKDYTEELKVLSKYVPELSHLKNENINSNKKFKYFKKFITGQWFEEYLYDILLELKQEIKYHEIYKNVVASTANQERQCELDIIIIRGYELILLSVTTYDKIENVKHKAFEALYRAEQLGGEHAKVRVVSLIYKDDKLTAKNKEDNLKKLTEKNNIVELKKDFTQFDADNNLEFLGIQDFFDEQNRFNENKFKENLVYIINKMR